MLSLVAGVSYGHDFWLEAHPFYTETNNPVELSVHVGNDYVGDSLPNITNWYSDFSLYAIDSKKNIKGEMGRDPAGYFTPQKPGTYLVGYQSVWRFVDLDSATFNKYLNEEGLLNAIRLREQQQQTTQAGKENYIRHAKALVQAGKTFNVDASTKAIGYELEIIPLSNPYKKNINDVLEVKILYQGKPAEDLLLIAFTRDNPTAAQRLRSDQNGKVSLKLSQPGDWLLKAVKIFPIDDDEADWQSHWASLTFSLK